MNLTELQLFFSLNRFAFSANIYLSVRLASANIYIVECVRYFKLDVDLSEVLGL